MARPYQYRPLQTEFHIRVLSFVHPLRRDTADSWNCSYDNENSLELHDAEFEIFEVDLRQQPAYHALSYVWGDPSTASTITIKDGSTISITENLRDALRRIVGGCKVKPIWIDQVCINQADLAERGHQVSIMGKIYMAAETTIVWLGEEIADDDGTNYINRLLYPILYIRRLPPAEKTKSKRKAWVKSNLALSFDPENETAEGNRFKAIELALNRPWFRRAWTFQEAVLSPMVLMLVGTAKFWLWELSRLVEDVKDLQYAIGGYRNTIMKTTKGWEPFNTMMELRGHGYRQHKNFLSFIWRVGGHWEATEKRDMIFSFLGLLNKPDLFEPLGFKIHADYSAPLRDLYISLTHTVIQGTKRLDMLGQVICLELRLHPEHMRIQEKLPSWVPDWAVSTPIISSFNRHGSNSFNACKSYEHTLVSSPKSEELLVRGRVIRKVVAAIDWNFDRHYFMDADRSFLNLDWHFQELTKVLSERGFSAPTRERVLKTLLADNAWQWKRVTTPESPSALSDEHVRALLHAYDTWPRLAAGETIPDQKTVEVNLYNLQQSSLIAQHKRLAVCEGGYLAMIPRVPAVMLEGFREEYGEEFEIGILHGSKTPVLMLDAEANAGLEPRTDGGPKPYKVYGQCYVENHMYGEVVDWEEQDADLLELW